ncbi:MAG: YceI family protein [Caldilineaceae bacterium]|nr:YceI family protein [Caldilineaceae bacterium]
MGQQRFIAWFLLSLMLLILVACGGATPTVAPTAPPTAQSQQPLAEGAQRFVVVPAESSAAYVVSEEFFAGALSKYGIAAGLGEVTGRTNEIAGELQLRLADPQNALALAEFTVNLPALTSDRSQRDSWIRDNALESNRFPVAHFVATAIQNAPASYTEGTEVTFQLLGDLTVREVTQPVTFTVTATLADGTIKGVATAPMQITDFGFDPPSFANTLTVANDFTIRIELTAHAE